LKYLFYLAVFAGILCGVVFPQLEICKPVIPYLIGFMLFLNFLEIKPEWNRLLRREVLFTLPLSALIMPLFVYYILSTGFMYEYRIGLFLVALAPSGIMMLILSRFVPDKDYNLILSNFFFTTFGSIIYIPFMIKWIIGATVTINLYTLLPQTAALILIPFFASSACWKYLRHEIIERLLRFSQYVIYALVFVIISISISGAAEHIIWDNSLIRISSAVFSIYVIQGGLGFTFGIFLRNTGIRHSLALIASSRNIQLVLAIAIINFSPVTVVPCVIGIFFHHLTNLIWLWLFRK